MCYISVLYSLLASARPQPQKRGSTRQLEVAGGGRGWWVGEVAGKERETKDLSYFYFWLSFFLLLPLLTLLMMVFTTWTTMEVRVCCICGRRLELRECQASGTERERGTGRGVGRWEEAICGRAGREHGGSWSKQAGPKEADNWAGGQTNREEEASEGAGHAGGGGQDGQVNRQSMTKAGQHWCCPASALIICSRYRDNFLK